MAYEHDDDRATRGVGAIASLDRSKGRRQFQRVENARATIRRDRAMSAVERGALGIIDHRKVQSTPASLEIRNRLVATPPTVRRMAPTETPPIFAQPTTGAKIVFPTDIPVPKPPVTSTDPAPTTSTASATAASSGMSSGAGTVQKTGGAGPITAIAPPITDLPDVDDPATSSTLMTPRNVLIAGGAVFAAYMLFMRKGRP